MKMMMTDGTELSIELEKNGIGGIDITATDTGFEVSGNQWYLLELRRDGTYERYDAISKGLGLTLNRNGKLKQYKG